MGGGHVIIFVEELEALKSIVERLQAKETQLERQFVGCDVECLLQVDQDVQIFYKIK
jgi:hypothetical protein